MKRIALGIACAALGAAVMISPAAAQQTGPAAAIAPGGTLLTVSADGKVEQKPDLAVFSAGVASTGATAGAALAANSADMSRVIAALRRSGIAERDIQTSNLSLNPVYAPQRPLPDGTVEPGDPKITGYQVTNSVTVRQRKLDDFGEVIDTLVGAGANQVNGPSFQIDQPDPMLDGARTDAMKTARARAQLYAQAAGLRVVRIVSISESGGYAPPPMYLARMSAASSPAPVAAGEVTLNVSVTVQFELAP